MPPQYIISDISWHQPRLVTVFSALFRKNGDSSQDKASAVCEVLHTENWRHSVQSWKLCGSNPVQSCWRSAEPSRRRDGGFTALKRRCTAKGDTVHDGEKKKKGHVGWSTQTEAVRVVKRTIIPMCCWEAHTCNPWILCSWICCRPASAAPLAAHVWSRRLTRGEVDESWWQTCHCVVH